MSRERGDGVEFVFRQHGVRLFAGREVLERQLRASIDRTGASRVVVVASPSVVSSGLASRVERALAEKHVGTYAGIDRDTSFETVIEAHDMAAAAGADLLVAVGGGSVLVGARAVAIFLAEDGDPFKIMTQYSERGAPRSPRLDAPKIPIINVPLTPTTAMDRAGVGLKNPDLKHRMEYFDPKVRPSAIFWDAEALRATPHGIFLETAFSVLVRALGDVAEASTSSLDDADRRTVLRLALDAVRSSSGGGLDLARRIDLCTAAFLQTRIEDARGKLRPNSAYAGHYGAATALHLHLPSMSQGAATSAVYSAALRASPVPTLEDSRRLATALGVWCDYMSDVQARDACSEVVVSIFEGAGMPTRLRGTGVTRDAIPAIAELTLNNFNHNSGEVNGMNERRQLAIHLLEDAW